MIRTHEAKRYLNLQPRFQGPLSTPRKYSVLSRGRERTLGARLLNLKATVDVQITALFLNWLPMGDIIGNSQTAKLMKDLRFQYEIAL